MPITMKFGMEEYAVGLHLHAKFGPDWKGMFRTEASKLENLAKSPFSEIFRTSVFFSSSFPSLLFSSFFPIPPLSASVPSLIYPIIPSPLLHIPSTSLFFPSVFPLPFLVSPLSSLPYSFSTFSFRFPSFPFSFTFSPVGGGYTHAVCIQRLGDAQVF